MKNQFETAAPYIPENPTLKRMREAAQHCKGCDLYKRATQAVFGEGPKHAEYMFVGEQPGDQEDLQGRPFVGPAGKVLDKALADAGIPRDDVYVTNAVKHFKWEERGKRRLHSKPSARQVDACRPWLEAEMTVVAPRLIVCLGATASQSLLGRAFRLTKHRGEVINGDGQRAIMATIHPSAIIRQPDDASRHQAYREFVADLKKAKSAVEKMAAAAGV